MKTYQLKNFTRGWVAGDFEPGVIRTKNFEFAVQYFKAGEKPAKHVHKIAGEISVVVFGEFIMNGRRLTAGDVIYLEPGEPAEFECLKDGATAVVKTPSVIGDKYLVA